MKKNLAKLLAVSLVLTAIFGLTTVQAAGSKTMRIGLAYKDTAVAAARLTNKVGSGYGFGYYDDQRQFVPLGWTGEGDIWALITQNQYLTTSGDYSYSSENNRGAVGCYHVHLPWPYEDFDSAQAAAQQVENGFVAWVEGAYYVRMGSYTRRADAEAAAAALGVEGACLGETSGYGYVVVAAGTARILFQFDANQAGETGAFGVVPMAGEGEKAVTVLDKGRSYYGGFRFERIDGGASTVVNMVDQEDYIKGVIPYEMSPSWPLEALKAQAVCARTYVNGINHSAYHFDVCTTTHCQVYKGTSGAGPVSDQAVEETAGLKIYYDGKCINGGAVYYSSNGGASEDVKNVWGTSHAYLKGKFDPYEADVANIAGNYRWSVSYTASELKTRLNDKLKEKGYTFGDIASVNIKQSEFGNVVEMQVVDSAGRSNTISRGDTIRSVLGTNSIHFTMVVSGGAKQEPGYMVAGAGSNAPDLEGLYALNGDGTVSSLPAQSYIITAEGVKPLEPVAGETVTGSGEATYTFSGTGWGHNVGMSQWGANAMAKRGYTYLDILQFYYTDITVE